MSDFYAILVRHAAYKQQPDTPSALQPFALTADGEKQATKAGQEIALLISKYQWSLSREVFCTHQLRAWQTATLLASSLDKETQIIEAAALSERSVGAFANLTITEIESILQEDPRYETPPKNWKSNSSYKLPAQGAESLVEAGIRVAKFLCEKAESKVQDTNPTANVFVGHGASFRHAASHLGVLTPAQLPMLSMHHAEPLVLNFNKEKGWRHFTGSWKERSLKHGLVD